jgi:hypothetical protein
LSQVVGAVACQELSDDAVEDRERGVLDETVRRLFKRHDQQWVEQRVCPLDFDAQLPISIEAGIRAGRVVSTVATLASRNAVELDAEQRRAIASAERVVDSRLIEEVSLVSRQFTGRVEL